MDKRSPTLDEVILEEAAGWLIRIEEAPETLTSAPFEHWLYADPRHVNAFTRMANECGAAAALVVETPTQKPYVRSQSHAGGLRRWAGKLRAPWLAGGLGALAAAAVALVFLYVPMSAPAGEAILYTTDIGEISRFDLADGSSLVLDTNSSARVSLTRTGREVSLERGRVFVDVKPDADRPFSVGEGEVSFTALGTSYAVERESDNWRLEVYEGTVRLKSLRESGVYGAGTGASFKPAGLTSFDLPQTLEPGQPNWTSGRVVFDATMLADAVQAFESYSDKHVTLIGGDLQTYEVSGVFRLTDMEAFLQSVVILTGARLSETGDEVELEAE